MDHDYKKALDWWMKYCEGETMHDEIVSALEIARKLQEGFVMVDAEIMTDTLLLVGQCVTPDGMKHLEALHQQITAAQETRKG